MTRDDMNTLLYLAIQSQQVDGEYNDQPEARSDDENRGLPLIAIITFVLLALLHFLIMTV